MSHKHRHKGWKEKIPLSYVNAIGSFVCYSINCTYQILSAFICLPAPIVHRGKREKRISWANPLNHYFRYLSSPCDTVFVPHNGDKFSLHTRQSQVPNNYDSFIALKIVTARSYWNLIYHLKREQEWGDFYAIVQFFCCWNICERKLNPLAVFTTKTRMFFEYQFFKLGKLYGREIEGNDRAHCSKWESTYIHRPYTYLFTTKHNEIDTVVASSTQMHSIFLFLLLLRASLDVLLCEKCTFLQFIYCCCRLFTIQLNT